MGLFSGCRLPGGKPRVPAATASLAALAPGPNCASLRASTDVSLHIPSRSICAHPSGYLTAQSRIRKVTSAKCYNQRPPLGHVDCSGPGSDRTVVTTAPFTVEGPFLKPGPDTLTGDSRRPTGSAARWLKARLPVQHCPRASCFSPQLCLHHPCFTSRQTSAPSPSHRPSPRPDDPQHGVCCRGARGRAPDITLAEGFLRPLHAQLPGSSPVAAPGRLLLDQDGP